jgi:hypothetical protein
LMFGCLNSPIEYMLHCNTVQASSPDYLALTTAALIHDFAQCWQLATLPTFHGKILRADLFLLQLLRSGDIYGPQYGRHKSKSER